MYLKYYFENTKILSLNAFKCKKRCIYIYIYIYIYAYMHIWHIIYLVLCVTIFFPILITPAAYTKYIDIHEIELNL